MCQRRQCVGLYRHSTGRRISENNSLKNTYLGKLKITQNPFKPKLTAILLKLVLYFRVALKPVSLTVHDNYLWCTLTSDVELPAGVGWGFEVGCEPGEYLIH